MRIKPKHSLNRKEMPHNLMDYATKLWSKYAQRKDAYCNASVNIDGSLFWQASKTRSIISRCAPSVKYSPSLMFAHFPLAQT